jgi:hypothetical protein
MKEIGGYFGLDENGGREYYPNALAFNTARNCLRFLIRHHGIKKIAIPDYNCEAVEKAIQKEDCDYYFYSVGRDLIPDISKVGDSDWLYIVNYYGQNSEFIDIVIAAHKNVIVDNVQAFFCKPFKEADNIYTCRKFFGVSDGAYLFSQNDHILHEYESLEIDKSGKRLGAVLGRYEDNAESHFKEYQEIEEDLDKLPILKMSYITHWLLKSIDYEQVISARNSNFSFLHEKLHSINEINIRNNVGPYVYPLLIKNGLNIRKKMIEKKIFISTLWPNVVRSCKEDSDAFYLASNLLPIPCDQRYGIDGMSYIVEAIKQSICD